MIIEWPEQVAWPLHGDGASHLEASLTFGVEEGERVATIRIGDADRAQGLRVDLRAAGLEVNDAA